MSSPASGAQKQRTDSEKVLFIVFFLFLFFVSLQKLQQLWGGGGGGWGQLLLQAKVVRNFRLLLYNPQKQR